MQGVDSVLRDAAPSLLGPSFRGSRPRLLLKRWPCWPWQPEAHGLVVEAVHDVLAEFDSYASLIQKLLEGSGRVSWATVCGACIGEAEDGVLFGSDGEVDQHLQTQPKSCEQDAQLCSGRYFHLRVRLSLAFPSGSPWSLASGRNGLHLCGFLMSVPLVRCAATAPRVVGTLQGYTGVMWDGLCCWSLSAGPHSRTMFGLQSGMRWLEAGCNSIVRVSAFALACCSPLAAV